MNNIQNIAKILYETSPLTLPVRMGVNLAANKDKPQAVLDTLFPKVNFLGQQQPVAQNIQEFTPQTPQKPKDFTPARRNYGFKPDSIQGMIVNEAYNRGVNPALALAIAKQESGFNPNAFGDQSVGGSYGLFQIHQPSHPGYKGKFDPKQNIQYGVGLLKSLNDRFGGDVNKVIQAYNAGAGAVSSGRIPASTRQTYLPNVLRFLNEFEGNTSNTQNTYLNNNQTLNESPLEGQVTPVVVESNINYPNVNLIPVNDQSDASKYLIQNLLSLRNSEMANNNPNDLLNRINMVSNIIGGANSVNRLPNLAPTEQEAEAYRQAYQQMGSNLMGQVQAANELLKAYGNDLENQRRANMANAVGRVVSGWLPQQTDLIFRDFKGNTIGQQQANRPVDLSSIGTEAYRNIPKQTDIVNAQLKLAQDLQKQQSDLATKQAQLNSAIRLSQATGLPLNVAANMTGEDYLKFIEPTQKGQQELAQLGAERIADLIQGDMESKGTLANTALQNEGDYAQTMATILGRVQERELAEQGANQRANLRAQVDLTMNNLNNQTKQVIAQQMGMNQQELERLRQSNPNSYYNAMANILGVGAWLNSPYAPTVLNQVLSNMVDSNNDTIQLPNNNDMTNDFWNMINQLRNK